MKFFIDSADTKAIAELLDAGVVDGITTNPSLIAKTGRDYFTVLRELAAMTAVPISAEVLATDFDSMIKEGITISKICPHIVVKIPTTWDGLRACSYLTNKEIKTNMTLCFSATQALMVAKAGATYVSPFIGRLDDIAADGLNLIDDIVQIFNNYPNLKTEVLVASVRSVNQVLSVARMGADIATLPPKLLKEMMNHPLTDKGIEIFLNDWKSTGQSI
jgi:transaldolase